ncbi:MAG: glutamine amidotransferase [Dehalococcoidia bacterium]|nr:glutamine amidotransferase [Dehalococcoidia bacterium]
MTSERPSLGTIRVVSLYDDVMSVYADRGNLLALQHRAAVLGVRVEVTRVSLGDALPVEADLLLIGGGQDREQRRIAQELATRGPKLRAWAEDDVAMLAVCGGFQLFGHWYRDSAGESLPGIGLFDVTTVAPGPGWARCIGDVLAVSTLDDVGEVVGFENHGGRTYLGPAARPFARVEHGFGNNGADGTEGCVYREAIGTYLHGSVLPKNLALLDHLIEAALRHRYGRDLRIAWEQDLYAARAHHAAAEVARRRAPRFEGVARP